MAASNARWGRSGLGPSFGLAKHGVSATWALQDRFWTPLGMPMTRMTLQEWILEPPGEDLDPPGVDFGASREGFGPYRSGFWSLPGASIHVIVHTCD